MLFNQILYFLVVLFIYLGFPVFEGHLLGPAADGLLVLLGLAGFGVLASTILGRQPNQAALTRWENRLTALAVALFSADVLFLGLKSLIHRLPGVAELTCLDGLGGLAVFYLYLLQVWLASWSAQRRLGRAASGLGPHLVDQLRWTLPLILPWFLISLAADLSERLIPEGAQPLIKSQIGEPISLAAILILLSLFLPLLVRYSWGCRPLAPGPTRFAILSFLAEQGVKVREILIWPMMGGRLLTAGVMGLISPLRYLLLTPALMERLSEAELRAVLAHEVGHVKYRHLLLYLLFFLGYLVLAFVLSDLVIQWLLGWEAVADRLLAGNGRQTAWMTGLISLPMLLLLVVYFRFIFAYFMRHFERQADSYAARVVGPGPVIAALERIALFSGLSRRAPSWHHFSIAQRIAFLTTQALDPEVARAHQRRLGRALLCYALGLGLVFLAAWPAGLYSSREHVELQLTLRSVDKALGVEAKKAPLHLYRAMILLQLDRPEEATQAFRACLALEPDNPTALNDLAWLYLTGPEELRRPDEALVMAQKAVRLAPHPAFFDTLAEALFTAGRRQEAVSAARMALAMEPENRAYYQGQLEKFNRVSEGSEGAGFP